MAPGPQPVHTSRRAQAELVADVLGVLVLGGVDRVAAPAHDEVRARLVVEQVRVAQHVEHRVGDGGGVGEVEAPAGDDLVGDEHHVAQHREQVLLDAADHLAVDEGGRRGILHLELHAPGMAQDADLEVAVAVEDFLGVVGGRRRSSAPPARSGGTAGTGPPARRRGACRSRSARGSRDCRADRRARRRTLRSRCSRRPLRQDVDRARRPARASRSRPCRRWRRRCSRRSSRGIS